MPTELIARELESNILLVYERLAVWQRGKDIFTQAAASPHKHGSSQKHVMQFLLRFESGGSISAATDHSISREQQHQHHSLYHISQAI